MSLLTRLLRFRPQVSDADRLLNRFDTTHKRSESQQAEYQKHRRIALKRDYPHPQAEHGDYDTP